MSFKQSCDVLHSIFQALGYLHEKQLSDWFLICDVINTVASVVSILIGATALAGVVASLADFAIRHLFVVFLVISFQHFHLVNGAVSQVTVSDSMGSRASQVDLRDGCDFG